jgi:hypothetical protein
VIWFFERDGQRLQVETTHDKVTRRFALTIEGADGAPRAESFHSKNHFERRLKALERELLAERWTPTGSALIPPSSDREQLN